MMKRWSEPTKSILLIFLISISFVLTSMLWNYQPQFELISPPTYTASDKVGQPKQIEELVEPRAIVFHYGLNRHTKAVYNDAQYRVITSQMNKWYFYDFVAYPLTDDKWESLTRTTKGVEIQFGAAVPVSVISQLVTFRGDMQEQMKGIERIWLYYEEAEGVVYALFISNQDRQVVRARTVVDPKDLEDSYLSLGKYLPEQILKVYKEDDSLARRNSSMTFWQIFYLPKEAQKMREFNYNYLPITDKQFIDTYFLDPSLVRQIIERDGTMIYTDGNRSIQIRQGQQAMTFTSPALEEAETLLTNEDKLRESIAFVNQHLGWTDEFRFESLEERGESGAQITFRQHIGAYPVVSNEGHELDQIQVTLEQGQVISVKRSLVDLDTFFQYKDITIMSAEELYHYLESEEVDTSEISNIYLAYHLNVLPGYAELKPSWVVEKWGTLYEVIDARSRIPGRGKENGLE
ncbi:YycH family regulatory protein [Brevibacillus dissolubilis]|uniref:YycH family regulatory protein n=1 Tax=Brevibacillus dissolubilis TaxID=1844116 RepID=UPI001116FE6D|nr:two-component system activity regulator YycH [Brevibacillus dissolubilis]